MFESAKENLEKSLIEGFFVYLPRFYIVFIIKSKI